MMGTAKKDAYIGDDAQAKRGILYIKVSISVYQFCTRLPRVLARELVQAVRHGGSRFVDSKQNRTEQNKLVSW